MLFGLAGCTPDVPWPTIDAAFTSHQHGVIEGVYGEFAPDPDRFAAKISYEPLLYNPNDPTRLVKGLYLGEDREIILSDLVAKAGDLALASTTRHETCHAYDHGPTQLTQTHTVWSDLTPEEYSGWDQVGQDTPREALAQQCEAGEPVLQVQHAVAQACEKPHIEEGASLILDLMFDRRATKGRANDLGGPRASVTLPPRTTVTQLATDPEQGRQLLSLRTASWNTYDLPLSSLSDSCTGTGCERLLQAAFSFPERHHRSDDLAENAVISTYWNHFHEVQTAPVLTHALVVGDLSDRRVDVLTPTCDADAIFPLLHAATDQAYLLVLPEGGGVLELYHVEDLR